MCTLPCRVASDLCSHPNTRRRWRTWLRQPVSLHLEYCSSAFAVHIRHTIGSAIFGDPFVSFVIVISVIMHLILAVL